MMTTNFEKRAIESMRQAGISMEHIQSQKKNVFHDPCVEYYYNKVEGSQSTRTDIPVKKITATAATSAVEGKSVFDLFMGRTAEGIEVEKFESELLSLEKKGLAFQHAAYVDSSKVKQASLLHFNYYKEEDCYILQGAGIHEVVSAKMFNALVISGVVTVYELDEEKKELYEEYNSLKDILRLTDIKGLTLDFFQEKKQFNKNKGNYPQ